MKITKRLYAYSIQIGDRFIMSNTETKLHELIKKYKK